MNLINLGDTTTLADPSVVDFSLVENRQNRDVIKI